jgi:hypothetical protein
MQIDVIKDIQDFAKLREHWDAVYFADPEAQFFLSWTWLSGYLKGTPKWFILAAKPDANASSPPVAFFPLRLRMAKTKEGGARKEVAMVGNRGADYTGFICIPEFQDEAIPALGSYIKRHNWDNLCLENILASDERTRLLLKCFPAENFHRKQIKLIDKRDNIDNYVCPYVNLPSEWEHYLNSNLSSNTRSKIRRFLRKVENSGEFRITHAAPETIEHDLDILLRFWGSKWKARKGEFLDRIQYFFRTMLMHCFESGSLFLPVLWKGEIPLAASAYLIDTKNRSLLFYVGGRDQAVTSPPPGFVLHAYSIRYAINSGFRTYDFLRGNEPYKYLFGAEERHIRYIIVSARMGTMSPRRPTTTAYPSASAGKPN